MNRQWHGIYDTTMYNKITIGEKSPDSTFDYIAQSVFEPGRRIKQIYFASLMTPPAENMEELNPHDDPLFQLMTTCPNVDSVTFNTRQQD